jgi:hypothetical protein
LFADIHDDLIDIVPGIEHHGILGAQFDGVAEPFGFDDDFPAQAFFLVSDVKIGPGGYGQQQNDADADYQLGPQAEPYVSD